jgi:hypothetical protein
MELFTDGQQRRGKVEEAVFRLQQKMGDGTLTKASLMGKRERRTPPTSPSERPSPRPDPSSGST